MTFVSHHMSATPEDLRGNAGRGRYVLLPGSPGRAEQIADRFEDKEVRRHPRGHDLHTGVLRHGKTAIDVAVIATGMGCPSLDIIVSCALSSLMSSKSSGSLSSFSAT